MNVALFASGTGSNVKNIIEYFKNNDEVNIAAVFSNKASAGALDHAKNANIDRHVFSYADLQQTTNILELLVREQIDLIVLAGFLLKIPAAFIAGFKGQIINLHPSLLPKYGGKGMYGAHVHSAVLAAKEKETGITIHFVNEQYDRGAIIKQYKTPLNSTDDLAAVQEKIKELEKNYFPSTIEGVIKNTNK